MDNSKILTWIPGTRLFPPFKLLAVVTYPAGVGDAAPHSHGFVQTVLVVSGQLVFMASGGERLLVEAGEMAVIPRGFPHAWAAERRCKAIQLSSEPMFAEDYGDLSALFGKPRGEWGKIMLGRGDFNRVVRRLLPELEKDGPGGATLVHACLLDLYASAFRAFREAGGAVPEEEGEGRELFRRALGFIHANYRKPLSLRELAANSHLGVSRFSELFRTFAGCSPMKYLAAHRLERAKTLLAYSDMSVTEVAEHLGFASIHYFSRAFKRHHGVEPSSFRRPSVQGVRS